MDSLTRGISQAVSGKTKKLDHLLSNPKVKEAKTKSIASKQRKRTKVKA